MQNNIPIKIRPAEPADIEKIFDLEKKIEPENPAPPDVLKSRLDMFNEGFLVAVIDDIVVGYVESLIWKEKDFDAFNQICQFSDHCDLDGDSIYIIFIAVDADFRRIGIASRLISKIVEIAKNYQLKRVCLVGKGEYINFYKKLGFTRKKNLPDFLPGETLIPCYMQCQVNDFKVPEYLLDDSEKPGEKSYLTLIRAGILKIKNMINANMSKKFLYICSSK